MSVDWKIVSSTVIGGLIVFVLAELVIRPRIGN